MYLDRPFLYNNRKFDIRHYMMIANIFGVTRAYWYEEGYIRTSSYEFNINSFEPEIHLTNDAVQKNFPDYHRYEAYNKVSYEEFQRYLDQAHSGKKYNFR
jgi:tubulin polyglutamylase TTLL1